MTTLNKAIKTYGFENPITITIAVLEEQGKTELAEELYQQCLTLGCEDWDEEEEPLTELSDEEYDEYLDEGDEVGFDPYEGCYTFDC